MRRLKITALALTLAACSSDAETPGAAVPTPDGGDPAPGNGNGNANGNGNGNGHGNGTDDLTGAPTQTHVAALPTVRQEHSVVALEGEVYVIGGFAPLVTQTVLAYDPDGDAWRGVADFPEAHHHPNAAVIDGKIYVAGFLTGLGFSNIDGRVVEYDPAADAWTERTPMPQERRRSSSCVAAHDGKLYVFGGFRGATVDEASVYDPARDAWEELPPLPRPREHCTAGSIGDAIYIASGRSGSIGGVQPETWAFDPVARTYEERAPLPTPRGGTAGAVLGGRLFVFGGEGNASDPSGVFPDVQAYDPEADAWEILPDMLVPRHGFGAATVDGRIYLPGGATVQAFGAVNDVTAFFFE